MGCHPGGETRLRGSALGSDLGSSEGLTPGTLAQPASLTQMTTSQAFVSRQTPPASLPIASRWICAPINSFNKYLLGVCKVSGTVPDSVGKPTLEVLTCYGISLAVSHMGCLLAWCKCQVLWSGLRPCPASLAPMTPADPPTSLLTTLCLSHCSPGPQEHEPATALLPLLHPCLECILVKRLISVPSKR